MRELGFILLDFYFVRTYFIELIEFLLDLGSNINTNITSIYI